MVAAPCRLGAPADRSGMGHATAVSSRFEEGTPCSAESASASPITFRAYSNRVCWNPPQVPISGQRWVRAKRIAANAPSILLYGLLDAMHTPSEFRKILSASRAAHPVATHFESMRLPSASAACPSERLMAWCVSYSGLKSPTMAMRAMRTALFRRPTINAIGWPVRIATRRTRRNVTTTLVYRILDEAEGAAE